MIRTSYNDIIVKIFFEGKEIQKVYQKGIQVFPEQAFDKFFWLKVFDEDDQKTYYYNCTQTSVIYQEGSTEIIKEIHYFTGQKQENHPGENQQIYELINDQVKTSGLEYSENDFESFVDKSPNEVIAMTQTYQEKIITGKSEGIQPNDYVNDNLVVENDISKLNTVLGYFNLKLSEFTGSVGDYKYITHWNKGYSKITNRCIGFIQVENTDVNDIAIQYILYSGYALAQYFITDSVDDINTVIKDGGAHDMYDITDLKHIVVCFGGFGSKWASGFTPVDQFRNKADSKKIYNLTIPAGKTYYFCCYWYSKLDNTADKSRWEWDDSVAIIFYNKTVNLLSDGNFLNHKYISDTTQEKQIGKIKYNFAYAMVKNDLSKKVYQTNCKYIISKEELPGINVNNVLQIPTKSLGWCLLTNAEFKTYNPKSSKYAFILTVSNFDYTGDEFFGLLDKSGDYRNDFRIFGAGNQDVYFDPGSDRTDYQRIMTKTTPVTFIINKINNTFDAWEEGQKTHTWYYGDKNCGGFTDNNTGLYLNAYQSEDYLTNEKFWFYEFKIVDVVSGEIIKRFVPSDDRTKLWECVSGKYIEPCRTVSDENLPVLVDNLKLGVETKDGLGNKIEDWLIY